MTEPAHQSLEDVSPAARYVAHILETADEPLSTAALAERTGMPERTVQYGLDGLREQDVLESQRVAGDARRLRYYLDP